MTPARIAVTLVLLCMGTLAWAAAGASPPSKPKPTVAAPAAPLECARCHNESGWKDVHFDHEPTRMPLRERHAEISCRACHKELHQLKLSAACVSCHTDVHAGRMGTACERCHEQRAFSSGSGVEAHSRTRFPLLGRHAFTNCEACHQVRADRSFGGVPSDCAACHAKDKDRLAGTALDHSGLGQDPDCRQCHSTVNFITNTFPQHDRCYPASAGAHASLGCKDCHTSLNGLDLQGCNSFTAACTRCHAHSCATMDERHRPAGRPPVAGYQCVDRKCFECHQG